METSTIAGTLNGTPEQVSRTIYNTPALITAIEREGLEEYIRNEQNRLEETIRMIYMQKGTETPIKAVETKQTT